MTVEKEYEQRNLEYMKDLAESNEEQSRLEYMDEFDITPEEYDEIFGGGE